MFIHVKLNLHSWLFFLQSPGIEKDDEIEDSVESSPNRDMTTYSQHYFGSIKDGFSISIIEVLIPCSNKRKWWVCFVFWDFLIFILPCCFPIRTWKKSTDYLCGLQVWFWPSTFGNRNHGFLGLMLLRWGEMRWLLLQSAFFLVLLKSHFR